MLSNRTSGKAAWLMGLAALALALPASAFAWNNFPQPGDRDANYNQGYYSPGYYGGMVLYPSAPVTRYQAAYPPDEEGQVNFTVQVPAGAEIWFNGHKTSQQGMSRRFVSPPLAPGNYTYEVRVRMKQNGQTVSQSRRVAVRPGDNLNLDFNAP